MLKAAVIRQALPADWFELGELQARSYHDAYRRLLPNDFLSKVTAENRQAGCRERLRDNQEYTAMLLVDNRAAGYISLGLPIDARSEDGEITALYLLREYWGHKLGTRLMGWGMERLRERGCTTAGLWVLEKNAGARRFYERRGFRPDGQQRVVMRGDAFVQLRYEKEIEA
ncbi:GNAT family N-acetyltransferase [Paenibacillus rhizovicinus]|uniref:GNAT family N-acetyltransferase n=1 Tax=Paenibacillus rhizovicinus TaxID=2704463 RepID=A0A6C0P5C1_9BACL|nr:GNAT family N-acetyltransferase [Paenibacillus rhizovicinus]QHW32983.1 GNAT family N-acetyltransferase [Paenibacillus rhizovicinus]